MCIRAISPQVNDSKDDFGDPRMIVVRCAFAEQRDINDWQRSVIFQTYIKCGDKTCKVIIDSGSYINAVSSNVLSYLGLKLISQPNPYKVSWVDTSSIAIKERCVVPLQFLIYQAEIWCDVIPMDVRHIILGRPWLYDLDVTLHGRSNSCSFMFEGKKIVLNPLKPKPIDISKKTKAQKAKGLNIISPKAFERVAIQESIVFVLVVRKARIGAT